MRLRLGGRPIEVKSTIADRLVQWWNPERGVARLKARTVLAAADGGYRGGRRDRRATRKWRPREASANADIIGDLPDLRARSSDLVRNVPIAGGAVATVVTNGVGDGLSLKPAIDRDVLGLSEEQADAWEKQAAREFALFSQHCDFTESLRHRGMQRLALRSVLELGDVLVVRRYREDPGCAYGTKIQLVEAQRVCNPYRKADTATMVAGVEFDADGVAIAYHIASRHPEDLASNVPLTWVRVPAFDPDTRLPLVLHLYDRLRVDQARGVPYLAPVIETLKKLSDYTEAELTAAVIAAMFTVFIKHDAEEGNPDDASVVGSDASDAVEDPQKEIALEDAGAIVDLGKGRSVEIANPGRPNPVFDAAVTAFVRQIGVALELPYELLIKHFTASYSASRAALEMAWQFFRHWRIWTAESFCQPTYEWAIEEAVARGRLAAPGFFADPLIRRAWLGAEWRGAVKINLDPMKESNADKQDIEIGVKTREQVITERTGGDFETKHRQLVKEESMREKGGLKSRPSVQRSSSAPQQDDPPPDHDAETEEERETA